MGYITPEYYKTEYMGEDAGSQIEKYIERASDIIDQVTNYILQGMEFDRFAEFIQTQVKKACASQVEFYVINDGDSGLNAGEDYSNFRIGSFDYSKGGASKNKQADRVSPAVWTYLEPTGLLYRGIGVVQDAYY
ncbi:hypothetical protein GCM10011391_28060 [Pullulanibacillus camelliae]|uniref:Uncharacterized protein n=1 Tax=Pullulanibacillus camelliae TaxID=1707096 RepID=A0A8J2YKA0_9BACL|nr:hypothetical protein [Pullulanibacillus camelliae]GGE47673.1 hypothetical protein GCM10011391_28060 [Pullulanibacillus camelliae]